MALSEKESYSVGRRWEYIFNRRKAKIARIRETPCTD